jgi:hypothetical protein
MREMRDKQERKIKQLEERVANEEYLVHVHEQRLKKIRMAHTVVNNLKNTK